ncbi:MAG: hypothetical protein QOJ34_2852, partial [Pseudonocardiales bacterium]|nr:hypothetical protein [Pseudonocardiales bacterium]
MVFGAGPTKTITRGFGTTRKTLTHRLPTAVNVLGAPRVEELAALVTGSAA